MPRRPQSPADCAANQDARPFPSAPFSIRPPASHELAGLPADAYPALHEWQILGDPAWNLLHAQRVAAHCRRIETQFLREFRSARCAASRSRSNPSGASSSRLNSSRLPPPRGLSIDLPPTSSAQCAWGASAADFIGNDVGNYRGPPLRNDFTRHVAWASRPCSPHEDTGETPVPRSINLELKSLLWRQACQVVLQRIEKICFPKARMKNLTVLTRTQTARPRRRGKAPTPADLERLLETGEPLPPEMSRADCEEMLEKLRRKFERKTCSAPWFDHCWEEGGTYPPKADTTPMRPCHCPRCRRIGKLWPFHYLSPRQFGKTSGFISFECRLDSLDDEEAARYPSSRSGTAMRSARERRIKPRRSRRRRGEREVSG